MTNNPAITLDILKTELIITCAVLMTVILPFVSCGNTRKSDCPQIDNCICQSASMKCSRVTEIPTNIPIFVQVLLLTDNAITEVKRSDFSHTNLTKLFLGNNKISTIDNDAFYDLDELKYINLSNNKLRTLDENIFKNNKKLIKLHLENNYDLVVLFPGLPISIEYLYLMNTNSIMPCNQMQKFLHLRIYYGKSCRNCSHLLKLNTRNDEDSDSFSAPGRSQLDSKTPLVDENRQSVPETDQHQTEQYFTNCVIYLMVGIIIGIIIGGSVVYIFIKISAKPATSTTGQGQPLIPDQN